MDPFDNKHSAGASMPKMPQIPDDVHSGHKKRMLQHLIGKAMGSGGAGIHETINSIKSALGAYKNYAKEWDNLGQPGQGAPSASGQPQAPQMNNPQPKQPQMPQQPQMPPMQHPQPPVPPQQPQMPKVNMPVVPQHPMIAPAMPSFMGGGNPPQTRF